MQKPRILTGPGQLIIGLSHKQLKHLRTGGEVLICARNQDGTEPLHILLICAHGQREFDYKVAHIQEEDEQGAIMQ
jgi:hypothetical protein